MKTKLTSKNIPKYLNGIELFKNVQITFVEEIKENTNVNFVFRVTTDSKIYPCFYIKQAFPYVKIKPNLPVPIERQYYEFKAINYIQRYWSKRIPKVMHYDRDNDVLILTDVSKDAKLLIDEVESGSLHLNVGRDLGFIMGKLHSKTYGKDNFPIRERKTNKEHIDFIIDFRLGGASETCAEETKDLFTESLISPSSLLHADWPHKNLYITGGNKIRIVDFENVVRFDPAFDIGYALADWVLEINIKNILDINSFVKDFVKEYSRMFQVKKDLRLILNRSTKYLGAMMLHRLVGVNNTNRRDEYLKREIDLVKLARFLLCSKNLKLKKTLESIDLNNFKSILLT